MFQKAVPLEAEAHACCECRFVVPPRARILCLRTYGSLERWTEQAHLV